MARFLYLVCVLASVLILTNGQTEETESTQASETEEDQSTSELTIPLTVPSFHSEDQKTEESTSTTPKEPVVTPTATRGTSSLYRYQGRDRNTCILLAVDALIVIKYKTTSGEIREKDVFVPDTTDISGSCNEDTANMVLKWPSFLINWSFSKTPGGERWYVNKLELQYELSSDIFEHIGNPGGIVRVSTAHSHANMLFPTPVGKSFTCNQELTVMLSAENTYDISILLRKFRLQPFIFKNDDFGPEYKCSPGGTTFHDEIAPIAVGSTLAIVVLLTVTGYSIYRYFKIKKVQYDTME